MAKKNVGYFDQHVEKVVVGVCALGMIGAAVYSLGGGRFSVEGRSPPKLAEEVAQATEAARTAILSAKAPDAPGAKAADAGQDPTAVLQLWFGASGKALTSIARVEPRLPRAQPFPPPLPFSAEALQAEKRNPARLVTPGVPLVVTGRSALFITDAKANLGTGEDPPQADRESKGTMVSWVSIGAQVDLLEQAANFISERYPPHSFLNIVSVHLQRKDESDPARGWQDVDTYVPYKQMEKPVDADGRVNLGEAAKYRKAHEFDHEWIARPALPYRFSGDKIELVPLPYLDEPPKKSPAAAPNPEPPEAEISKRVKKWTDMAKLAAEGKRQFKQPDLDAAFILARAAVAASSGAKEKEAKSAKQIYDDIVAKLPKTKKALASAPARAPERLMPIVAHDLTALPGHTHVYRLRYEVYNIYAGNPSALVNPEDAEKLTLFSEWSPESRPVEIPSDMYFFLTKAEKAAGKATVTVFRKKSGLVDKQEFQVRAGEKIGKKEEKGAKRDFSTGAVCIDVDFDRLVDGKKDVALVYADAASGVLYERLLSKDAQSKVFKQLLEFKPPTKP